MRKKLLIVAVLAAAMLSTSGCQVADVVAHPATAAARTTLDEKAAIAAESAYTAAALAGARLVQLGLVDRARFKQLDHQAWDAVQAERAAYAAGNAASFAEAITQIHAATTAIRDLTQKGQ